MRKIILFLLIVTLILVSTGRVFLIYADPWYQIFYKHIKDATNLSTIEGLVLEDTGFEIDFYVRYYAEANITTIKASVWPVVHLKMVGILDKHYGRTVSFTLSVSKVSAGPNADLSVDINYDESGFEAGSRQSLEGFAILFEFAASAIHEV